MATIASAIRWPTTATTRAEKNVFIIISGICLRAQAGQPFGKNDRAMLTTEKMVEPPYGHRAPDHLGNKEVNDEFGS